MSSQYRILEFVPDPFLGTGVPYAALVREQGHVLHALAERVPGPDCLGSTAAAHALAYCRELTRALDQFEALPLWAGPQVRLGPIRDVPAGVMNAAEWVTRHVLPRSTGAARGRSVRAPRRTVVAQNFLKQIGVTHVVHRSFDPGDYFRSLLPDRRAPWPKVAHFAESGDRLLLLEAVRVEEPQDVEHVTTTFLAYGELLRQFSARETTERLTYLLPGNGSNVRSELLEQLETSSDRVIDTGSAAGRTEFRNHVLDFAGTGLQ